MSGQAVTIVVALMVPIVTAVVGLLGVMFQNWYSRRTQAGRRKLALEDARLQVSFVTEWWNARKLISDSPEAIEEATNLAARWLEEASEQVAGSEKPMAVDKPQITFRGLLLLVPVHGLTAQIVRVLFYLSLAIFTLEVAITITDAVQGNTFVGNDVFILIFLALITLILRFGAAYASRGRQRRSAAGSHVFL